MMMAMLVAGIACLVAGLSAIGFGIPVNEFSFGNTLILAGAVGVCAGLIILSMWAAVGELKKNMAAWIGSGPALDRMGGMATPAVPALPTALDGAEDHSAEGLADGGEASAFPSPPAAPWQGDAAARERAAPSQEPPAAPKPRRNLMFSSSSRRERERAQARAANPPAGEPQSTVAGTSQGQDSPAAPPPFDDWPRSERSRTTEPGFQRRRPASTSSESPTRQTPAAPAEDQSAVTVLKSGVVDGMAYSLYSDGSIEAQMPEGMMRFGSIDELRAHLDHRP